LVFPVQGQKKKLWEMPTPKHQHKSPKKGKRSQLRRMDEHRSIGSIDNGAASNATSPVKFGDIDGQLASTLTDSNRGSIGGSSSISRDRSNSAAAEAAAEAAAAVELELEQGLKNRERQRKLQEHITYELQSLTAEQLENVLSTLPLPTSTPPLYDK
jgi:hypothetical protein